LGFVVVIVFLNISAIITYQKKTVDMLVWKGARL